MISRSEISGWYSRLQASRNGVRPVFALPRQIELDQEITGRELGLQYRPFSRQKTRAVSPSFTGMISRFESLNKAALRRGIASTAAGVPLQEEMSSRASSKPSCHRSLLLQHSHPQPGFSLDFRPSPPYRM
jgi:hypothetical protein